MNLLKKFLSSIQSWWQLVFGNKRTETRAEEHALGGLCGESPHTITSIIEFKGSESEDCSADYSNYECFYLKK